MVSPPSRPLSSNSSALEVGRDLDVHAGAQRRHDVGDLHPSVVDEPGEDVVAVRPDDELVDRHAHLLRDPARRTRCRSCRWARRTTRAVPRSRRVRSLQSRSRRPAPSTRAQLIEFTAPRRCSLAERRVGEQRLHQVLAVVERALDARRCGRWARRPSSSAGAAPRRPGRRGAARRCRGWSRATAGLDGGRAGVARGGDDDRGPLAAAAELVVEQAADELQGDVLERERRARGRARAATGRRPSCTSGHTSGWRKVA